MKVVFQIPGGIEFIKEVHDTPPLYQIGLPKQLTQIWHDRPVEGEVWNGPHSHPAELLVLEFRFDPEKRTYNYIGWKI